MIPTREDLQDLERAIAANERLTERQKEVQKWAIENAKLNAEINTERIAQLQEEARFLSMAAEKQGELYDAANQYSKLIADARSISEAQHRKEVAFIQEEIRLKRKEFEEELKSKTAGLEANEADAERESLTKQYSLELEKLIKKQKEYNLALQEETNANDVAAESFTQVLNNLGIKTEKQKLTMIEAMAVGQFNQQELNQQVIDFATSGVAAQRVMASLGAKVVESTITMMKQLDSLMADMYKLTGGSTALREEFGELADRAGSSGVAFKTMGESISGLMKTSSNFTELTKSQRQAVAANNAQLIALGVSADVAGKNFSIFTQALGMTAQQANASSRELVSLANNIGVSFEQVASDFGQAATTVAAYGQGAVREFSKLAAESKALGLSVQELINIVKGADTFQGAAEQAGKLNAMLGGGLLNSSQLLVASESERIQLIRDAVMQTGRSFETMSKYEQIAIANAAGIQDLTVAQKLFNQQISGSELDRYLGKTNALGQSQEEMKAQALAAQSTQEKFAIIMEQFAASMQPVVTALGYIMSAFVYLAPLIKTLATAYMALITIKYTVAAATAVTTFWSNLAVAASIREELANKRGAAAIFALGMAKVAAGMRAAGAAVYNFLFASSLGAVEASSKRALITFVLLAAALVLIFTVLHLAGSPMLYAIFGFVALGILFMGEAAEKNKKGLLAFGAAMMMVGIGAFLAFHGLEGFAIALSKLSPEQLNALVLVILILTVALVLMFAAVLYAGTAAIGPLLALGAAFLMMGAGAYIAALGFSMIADSFIKLAQNMETLIMLPLFLQLMAVSLIAVSVGLAIFAYTLINVGFAMMAAYIPILAVIGAITALSLAINSIAPEKSIALKATTESIRNFVDTGKQVTPEAIGNLDQVIKQIHKLNIEATISKAVNVTAPFKELIDAVKGQTAATAANKETTVVMKLNDREFGKAVVGVMNEYGTNNTSIRKPTPA
jgi:hypothetical protein